LKEEALDHTIWRACFGRGFGPVIRQTTKWMNHLQSLDLLSEFHFGCVCLFKSHCSCVSVSVCMHITSEGFIMMEFGMHDFCKNFHFRFGWNGTQMMDFYVFHLFVLDL
jgi:hypothetical protein